MTILDRLAEAEARVEAIRRELAVTACAEAGHAWRHVGGRNAGCSHLGDVCMCSVPVHVCDKCGDCDYGETREADETRGRCAREHEDQGL